MRRSPRCLALAVLLCASSMPLSATPATAGPLWLYDVVGSGFQIENDRYTDQQSAISGTVLVELASYLPGPPYSFWHVTGYADFDLEFMAHRFTAADQVITLTNDHEGYANIGGVPFYFPITVISPSEPCFDPMLAGSCFVSRGDTSMWLFDWYRYYFSGGNRPPAEAPLWMVNADMGLFPEWIALSNPRPVADAGSTFLLLSIGVAGLRAWRTRFG